MKKLFFIAILTSYGVNVLADEHYKCYNLKNSHLSEEISMKINTALLSNKITSIELISKIKTSRLEAVENPFSTLGLSAAELNPQAISEASQLNFKSITKKESENLYTIAVSDSILSFKEVGYAHYHSKACFWILDCHESYEYFKCEKI